MQRFTCLPLAFYMNLTWPSRRHRLSCHTRTAFSHTVRWSCLFKARMVLRSSKCHLQPRTQLMIGTSWWLAWSTVGGAVVLPRSPLLQTPSTYGLVPFRQTLKVGSASHQLAGGHDLFPFLPNHHISIAALRAPPVPDVLLQQDGDDPEDEIALVAPASGSVAGEHGAEGGPEEAHVFQDIAINVVTTAPNCWRRLSTTSPSCYFPVAVEYDDAAPSAGHAISSNAAPAVSAAILDDDSPIQASQDDGFKAPFTVFDEVFDFGTFTGRPLGRTGIHCGCVRPGAHSWPPLRSGAGIRACVIAQSTGGSYSG